MSEATLSPALISRLFFHNQRALAGYGQGRLPDVRDIARDVFVAEWRRESQFPDHYLKNRRDFVLSPEIGGAGAANTLAQLIIRVLDDIGDHYLEWNGDKLYVPEGRYSEWQELLTLISPLLVLVRKIHREAGGFPSSPGRARDEYVRRWLRPNLRVSALPYPMNPLIEGFIRNEGLIESHMHMNGSTEADIVWLDAVSRPTEFYRELKKALKGRG